MESSPRLFAQPRNAVQWTSLAAAGGAALAALILAVCGVGLLLPDEWRIERSIQVNASPDKVHATLDGRDGWREMMAWSEQRYPDQVLLPGGPPDRGEGTTMQWVKDGSSMTVTLTKSDPPKFIGFSLVTRKPDMQLVGALRLVKKGVGTEVTWVESGELGMNPFRRIRAYTAKSSEERDVDSALARLKRVVEDRAAQGPPGGAVEAKPGR